MAQITIAGSQFPTTSRRWSTRTAALAPIILASIKQQWESCSLRAIGFHLRRLLTRASSLPYSAHAITSRRSSIKETRNRPVLHCVALRCTALVAYARHHDSQVVETGACHASARRLVSMCPVQYCTRLVIHTMAVQNQQHTIVADTQVH